MRRIPALPLCLALSACAGAPAPRPSAGAPPPPSIPVTSPRPAPPAPAAPATTAAPPATPVAPEEGFAATVARLASLAPSDPDLAGHADLLEALARATDPVTEETRIVRLPRLEADERARQGRGTGWATLTTYRQSSTDAGALRRAYLDYDRVPEWTGKPGTRVLRREGDAVVALADGVRTALGMRFGARWAFRARPLDRGAARLVVARQVDSPDAEGMLSTRSVLVIVPDGAGVRVAEVACSVLAMEVPGLLRSVAEDVARRELRARTDGIRSHWRDYAQ